MKSDSESSGSRPVTIYFYLVPSKMQLRQRSFLIWGCLFWNCSLSYIVSLFHWYKMSSGHTVYKSVKSEPPLCSHGSANSHFSSQICKLLNETYTSPLSYCFWGKQLSGSLVVSHISWKLFVFLITTSMLPFTMSWKQA